MPASFCGVAGFKPSYGLVSAAGVIAQSYGSDHVGPIARSVEDVAAAMAILAGHDPDDPTSTADDPPRFTLDKDKGMPGLRVGIPRELMNFPLQPDIAPLFDSTLVVMRGLGAQPQEVQSPFLRGRAGLTTRSCHRRRLRSIWNGAAPGSKSGQLLSRILILIDAAFSR